MQNDAHMNYSVTPDDKAVARFPCYPSYNTFAHLTYEVHFVRMNDFLFQCSWLTLLIGWLAP